MLERRKDKWTCPKCQHHFPCVYVNEIRCLNTACDYKVEAKRVTDKDVPCVQELRYRYG
jgi:hypothetical protein